MRYAIYSLDTSELLRVENSLSYNEETEGYTEVADVIVGTPIWYKPMLNFIDANDTSYKISPLAFLKRFQTGERLEVHSLAKTDPVVTDFLYMLTIAHEVDLTSVETTAVLMYLESVGVLFTGRRSVIRGF